LRPQESQHARPPCPSPPPGVHSDSCPSSQWCHPATSCEELTHWKRLWCWEGLGARGEGDDRGWDGWMASLTRWTWVWVNSGRWWWTGRPGVLRFLGSQGVGHDWATDLIKLAFISIFKRQNMAVYVFMDSYIYIKSIKTKKENNQNSDCLWGRARATTAKC